MIEKEDLRNTQLVINKTENTKVAVIVEPRRHEFLEEVIRNVMFMLPHDEWNLHIITSKENADWIVSLFPNWKFKLSLLNVSNLNRDEHNHFLMTESFWMNINEENILIFQTDVMLFNDNINDFLEYDFIGANFFDPNDVSLEWGGNNGGFSFRHKSAMLDCVCNVSILDVQKYLYSHGKLVKSYMSEDVYFTSACEILNKHLCPLNKRPKFSIEDARKEYYDKPVGCHRFASAEFAVILMDVLKASPYTSKWIPHD